MRPQQLPVVRTAAALWRLALLPRITSPLGGRGVLFGVIVGTLCEGQSGGRYG